MTDDKAKSVQRLARVIAATENGEVLSRADGEWLVHGLRNAIFETGVTIEAALGLRDRWRQELRFEVRDQAIAGVERRGESDRAAALKLRRKLINYRNTKFESDKAAPPRSGERAVFFHIVMSCGCRVPGLTVLREWLGQKSPLNSGHESVEGRIDNEVPNGKIDRARKGSAPDR